MLKEVEGSAVWGDCFEKAQIGKMIMRVIGVEQEEEEEIAEKKKGAEVKVVEVDEYAEAPALWHDGPHLKREFGVPDRFTIMTLN